MQVEDIMERDIEAVEARTSAEDAWAQMRSRRLRSLLVTDGAKILGSVTRARVRGSGALHRRDKVVADFLPQGHVTAAPDCGLLQAASLLEGRADGCVPVLVRGHLAGVITLSGLLCRLAALEHPVRRRP